LLGHRFGKAPGNLVTQLLQLTMTHPLAFKLKLFKFIWIIGFAALLDLIR